MRLRRRTAGFTLVEVMVTVFVVAIGLLSAAALQAVSKKAAFDAVQRSSANALAQDLIERMRGNRAQLKLYFGSDGSSLTVSAASPPGAQTCDSSSACSAAQLAAHDLYQWWLGLEGVSEQVLEGSGSGATRSSAGGLRSPTGCLSREKDSCRVVVAIAWRGMSRISQGDPDDPEDPTNNSCGQASNNLNADYEWDAGSEQSYRRVLVVEANLGEGRSCP